MSDLIKLIVCELPYNLKENNPKLNMVKFKITYKTPTIPVQLKKLVELKAKTPEEAWLEIKSQISVKGKHSYLHGEIKNLVGIEQQELSP